MKKILLLTVSFVILITAGCKKSKDEYIRKKENILSAKGHVVDTLAVASLSENSVNIYKNQLTFMPAVGDILLSSPGGNTPYGMLVKILSITDNGSVFDCKIESSNLNEAFAQLYIDYTQSVPYSSGATLKTTDGNISLSTTFAHKKLFSSGLDINGNLQLVFPSTTVKYVKDSGSILPDTVIVSTSFNSAASRLELSSTPVHVSGNIYEYNGIPDLRVPIPVGGIILWIPFQQKVSIDGSAAITGKMKFVVIPAVSATLGVSYINGSWKNLSDFRIGATADRFKKDDFEDELSANVELTPKYELFPFHLKELNLFFEIPNTLEATIKKAAPNYELKYKVGVRAGGEVRFWTGPAIRAAFDIPIYEPTILKGNWGYNIGDTAFGGVIFYLDSISLYPNQHGLVCALNDQRSSAKFCDDIVNPWPFFGKYGDDDTTTIGNGSAKTIEIATSYSGHVNIASSCQTYTGGGYSDWFLPSNGELRELYRNKESVKVMGRGVYWSSSAYGYSNVPYTSRVVNFSNGNSELYYTQMNGVNDLANSWWGDLPLAKVRAIRKF